MAILAVTLLAAFLGWALARTADAAVLGLLARVAGATGGVVLIGAMIATSENTDRHAYYLGIAAMILAGTAITSGFAAALQWVRRT